MARMAKLHRLLGIRCDGKQGKIENRSWGYIRDQFLHWLDYISWFKSGVYKNSVCNMALSLVFVKNVVCFLFYKGGSTLKSI